MRDVAQCRALKCVAAALFAAAAFPAVSLAQTFDRGQALYENHCKSCHESWAHARQGREAASINAVRKRVAAWSIHSGLNWSEADIEDVVDYLNRKFYRFGE
jgi:mono/diheme cytochrome c family protein